MVIVIAWCNQSIRECTEQPTASSLLRQRRLRWFWHLHRMPSSLHVRRVFDFNPNIHGWKRPRGRPKTRSADSIKHDLHSAGLDTINAAQMVYDRPQWKAIGSNTPMSNGEQGILMHACRVECWTRLSVRKYSFSQTTIHEWNELGLYADCVHARSVNTF